MRCKALAIVLLQATSMSALPALADDVLLVDIDDLAPVGLARQGFELAGAQDVRIEARGIQSKRHGHRPPADAWILDVDSREVVWSMADSRSDRRRRGIEEYSDDVRLDAGRYEAYYATSPTWRTWHEGDSWWESAARSMARALGWDDFADVVRELELTVRGAGRRLAADELETAQELLREEALVSIRADSDQFSARIGFALEQPVELQIYAVGELTDAGGYDYGWIIDADSRQKVWTFDRRGSRGAGGADKNRQVLDSVSLPAGRYAAVYTTDGSHSPGDWNSLPPHDPDFWGLTLWLRDPSQRRFASRFDYQHLPGEERVIAAIARVRDDEVKSRGFTLTEPMDVRVYAVGEGTGRGMVDYGWIVDARTRERLWVMRYEDTDHAGGSPKNRVGDAIVRLGAGSYLLTYVADGSHAYREWNADPPSEPELWGITVFAPDGFDPATITEYREELDDALLARIARARNHRHERIDFSLERDAHISIYALGEGTGGRMYDYGWLEDDVSGQVVWEMTYPITDAAGGASKNRSFQGTVFLEAGDYTLHYRTDDSHAFGDWNASPPYDPEGWGIQVALIE